jgi:hypothetical protein
MAAHLDILSQRGPVRCGPFGDGKADILWRHSSGQVAIWLMEGATVLPGTVTADWSVAGTGDFNNDGFWP